MMPLILLLPRYSPIVTTSMKALERIPGRELLPVRHAGDRGERPRGVDREVLEVVMGGTER